MEETSSGLKENMAGLLCYALGIITGLFFFLTEKKNKFVRFHSLQAIFFSVVWLILQVVIGLLFSFVPFLFKFILPLVNLAGVIFWVILMVKAYQGEYFLLPVLGKMALDNSEIKQ
ncbi:MAG: DUF4870 domain-containing protein [Candidatus Omnitrophica bacterium]|nr:DUF4870 domain-containing protein [Candidatus Omnitrophota bacterium]